MAPNIERKTYESRDAVYSLNPEEVFSVVDGLEEYVKYAEYKTKEDNPHRTPSAVGLYGKGRKMILFAEVVNKPGSLEPFHLAELVLSEDREKLTFTTHRHPRVTVPSNVLEVLAERYQIE